MEGVNSNQRKILEIIFLGKCLMCRSKTNKIKCLETFKAIKKFG